MTLEVTQSRENTTLIFRVLIIECFQVEVNEITSKDIISTRKYNRN